LIKYLINGNASCISIQRIDIGTYVLYIDHIRRLACKLYTR